MRFVVSLRLGRARRRSSRCAARLDRYPGLRFKLDPTTDWNDELVAELAATGAVDSVDFKGQYRAPSSTTPPDPELYARVLRALPDAWIEDPHADPARSTAVLEPHRERITWDAPIHSRRRHRGAALGRRGWSTSSRRASGPLRELLAAYEHCEAHGIGMYGGGQFELGPGRGQIQYLASLFHADGPNDVAPGGYNDPDPRRRPARQPARAAAERRRLPLGLDDGAQVPPESCVSGAMRRLLAPLALLCTLFACGTAQAVEDIPGGEWSSTYITEPDGTSLHAAILRPSHLKPTDKSPVILTVSVYDNSSGESGPSGRPRTSRTTRWARARGRGSTTGTFSTTRA